MTLVSETFEKTFESAIAVAANQIFEGNKAKGFWDGERNKLEQQMLIVSEVAEMTEAVRRKEAIPSPKIPEFTEEEEEAADVFIRLLDYAGGHSLRLGEAVLAKLRYNASRPYKHGKAC